MKEHQCLPETGLSNRKVWLRAERLPGTHGALSLIPSMGAGDSETDTPILPPPLSKMSHLHGSQRPAREAWLCAVT